MWGNGTARGDLNGGKTNHDVLSGGLAHVRRAPAMEGAIAIANAH